MRCLLLLLGLLLPQLLRAQFVVFEPGSYVLAGSPTVRHTGQLKLRGNNLLLVKDEHGTKLKLPVGDVASFRLGGRKYVTAGNFHVKGGLGGADVDNAFVEQLDSGQVVLLTYKYSVGAGAPMSMGAGGGMSYGGASEFSAYLLSRPGDSRVTAAQGSFYTGGGKQFREAVRPYLASRPDLVKLLDEKRISNDNLEAVIHALNNNLPFSPPAAVPSTD